MSAHTPPAAAPVAFVRDRCRGGAASPFSAGPAGREPNRREVPR
jgi:hypothetical protein